MYYTTLLFIMKAKMSEAMSYAIIEEGGLDEKKLVNVPNDC